MIRHCFHLHKQAKGLHSLKWYYNIAHCFQAFCIFQRCNGILASLFHGWAMSISLKFICSWGRAKLFKHLPIKTGYFAGICQLNAPVVKIRERKCLHHTGILLAQFMARPPAAEVRKSEARLCRQNEDSAPACLQKFQRLDIVMI